MSTRSIILVHGQDLYEANATVRLYKHSDGYPSANLPIIQTALLMAQQHQYDDDKTGLRINVSTMVGLLIGAATDEYGMGARIDRDEAQYAEKFEPKHLGDQADLEWIYVVDLYAKTVSIYGGGYTGKSPQAAFKKGCADPLSYVDCLVDEAKDDERTAIKEAIKGIEAWSFKVNPEKPKPVRKTKAQKQAEEFERQLATMADLAQKQGLTIQDDGVVIQFIRKSGLDARGVK
jgi:hypothetical protein